MRARRPVVGGDVDRGELEHHVGDHRSDARADHLRDHVHARVARAHPAEQTVGHGDDRVEVRARHRPEREDQRHEARAGGDRVLEELQPDVVGGEALRGDAGPDDDRDEERGAHRFRRRASCQAQLVQQRRARSAPAGSHRAQLARRHARRRRARCRSPTARRRGRRPTPCPAGRSSTPPGPRPRWPGRRR